MAKQDLDFETNWASSAYLPQHPVPLHWWCFITHNKSLFWRLPWLHFPSQVELMFPSTLYLDIQTRKRLHRTHQLTVPTVVSWGRGNSCLRTGYSTPGACSFSCTNCSVVRPLWFGFLWRVLALWEGSVWWRAMLALFNWHCINTYQPKPFSSC